MNVQTLKIQLYLDPNQNQVLSIRTKKQKNYLSKFVIALG